MAQTNALLDTLKASLKSHRITYADVAKHLQLSEASIKRLFSEASISLQRLDQICQMMELEISDLTQMMNEKRPQLQQLTHEQESQLASDILLLMVTVCVLNRWTFTDILSFYNLSEHECIQKLAQLDRLQLIELQPQNRIKLRIAPNFSWRENGPIQQFFLNKIQQEFFNTRFDHKDEQLLVFNGMLSPQSNAEFQRKMQRLAQEFDELNNQDASLPMAQRFGSTVVVAMRSWKYGLFAPYRR